jgi:hypothetical protein
VDRALPAARQQGCQYQQRCNEKCSAGAKQTLLSLLLLYFVPRAQSAMAFQSGSFCDVN